MSTQVEWYDFRYKLQYLYETAGVNDYIVSEKTGISISTFNKWRNMESVPSTESLIKLSDFFDCSIDYLIGNSKHSEKMDHAIDCLSYENQKLVEQYAKLLFLKQTQEEKELNDAYEKISSEITDFDKKYRFADRNEKELIEHFLSGLRFSANGIRFAITSLTFHNRVILCFMSGKKPMLNNYLVGNYLDFLDDLKILSDLSPYQLLFDADAKPDSRTCVFVNSDGNWFDVIF